MRRRLADAILLLYPRRVREVHGPEIVAVIDDLVARDGRSPARLFARLAVDGLIQRVASTAALWTVAATLAVTSLGGLAVSDLAAARSLRSAPRTAHAAATRPSATAPAARDGREKMQRPRATERRDRKE
jgi:hypothetical protein